MEDRRDFGESKILESQGERDKSRGEREANLENDGIFGGNPNLNRFEMTKMPPIAIGYTLDNNLNSVNEIKS